MGHDEAAVWTYTPKRIVGYLHFASVRIRRERAADLSTGFSAARGNPRDVKTQIKDLQKD